MGAVALEVEMANGDPVTIMTWTIATSDGVETVHTYDLPEDDQQIIQLAEAITMNIANALNGTNAFVHLINPYVTYNPAHIVRVRFDAFGQTDIEKAVEEAQPVTGFRPPGT